MLRSRGLISCAVVCIPLAGFSLVAMSQVPDSPAAPAVADPLANAEAPPPNKPDDAIKSAPEPTDPQSKSAKAEAKEWVKSSGWKTGRNRKDGSFIAIGTAPYDGNSANVSRTRTLAFQEALLRAKNEIARFLSADIQAAAAAAVSQGKMPRTPEGVPVDVVEQVAAAAKKDGIAGDAIGNGTSRQFARSVQVLARAQVAGSSVVKIIDNGKPGDDGGMAVVVRWSPKTKALAEAALGLKKDPVLSATAPAVTEIESLSEADLQSIFGARVMRSDDNEACIVAFGQGEAADTGEDELDIAGEKAQVDAFGNLRLFVGEMILCNQLLNQSSSLQRLGEGGKVFDSAEGFGRECEARANFLNMAGIEEVRTWEGQRQGALPVVGYVGLWSVSGSNDAIAMRNEFTRVNPGAGGAGRSNLPTGPQAGGGNRVVTPGRVLPALPGGASKSPDLGKSVE
jgi:hypothetical protein